MTGIIRLVAAVILLLIPGRLAAESLTIGLATRTFEITSNFTGDSIVLFGTIDRDAATISRAGQYDVIAVIRGPITNIVTRQKERVAGIWVNTRAEVFPGAPSYYVALTTRPLPEIAGEAVLREHGLGTAYLALQPADSDLPFEDETFRNAMIRLKGERDLYRDQIGAVEFLSNTLFRSEIPLPEAVPTGRFTVDIYLFRDSALLNRERVTFTIRKSGLEQSLFAFANDRPTLYGLFAVLVAVFTGWIGAVMFRKD